MRALVYRIYGQFYVISSDSTELNFIVCKYLTQHRELFACCLSSQFVLSAFVQYNIRKKKKKRKKTNFNIQHLLFIWHKIFFVCICTNTSICVSTARVQCRKSVKSSFHQVQLNGKVFSSFASCVQWIIFFFLLCLKLWVEFRAIRVKMLRLQ